MHDADVGRLELTRHIAADGLNRRRLGARGELHVDPPPEIPQETGRRWQQAMMALPMLGGSVPMQTPRPMQVSRPMRMRSSRPLLMTSSVKAARAER